LACLRCGTEYEVRDGIPILLPEHVPNPDELEVRRRVSEALEEHVADWRAEYDRHHFRALAGLRLERFLHTSRPRPRLLDIGTGWGVPYLPFAAEIELWGLDFSLESLMVLRRIF